MTLRDQLHEIAVRLDAAPKLAQESAARSLAAQLSAMPPEEREQFPERTYVGGFVEGWLEGELREAVARLARIVADLDAGRAAA
ncbi:MAG: hypothetical protein C4558_06310 [Dehalococcoidia bacterium]|nr:MAG: hypothetical protein C4558_06310 [Dehalococcoidia bacterium]